MKDHKNIMKQKTIYERLNDSQQEDYSVKTNGDFRRQLDKDITHASMENINDGEYYSSYRVNGKDVKHRTIKMSNKEWHRLNTIQK